MNLNVTTNDLLTLIGRQQVQLAVLESQVAEQGRQLAEAQKQLVGSNGHANNGRLVGVLPGQTPAE